MHLNKVGWNKRLFHIAPISRFKKREKVFIMSIPDKFATGQQAGQPSQAAGCHPHLSDLLHIGQMERLLKHALEELERVRARLSPIERETAIQSSVKARTEKVVNAQQDETSSPVPPLPIAEIKQLAEMAKRFR
jgi:hypothetical protein